MDTEESAPATTLSAAGSQESLPQDQADGEIKAEDATAQSLKCNDCGKHFRNTVAAEFHASKTGHVDFEESTQVIKPLTEEEKNAKLAEIQEKLAKKRAERAAEAAKEARANEQIRRKAGQDLVAAKEKMKEKEMQKALELKKREKEEERLAKERIRKQIEMDKLERQRKLQESKQGSSGNLSATTPTSATPAATTATATASSASYTEARLQIRFQNGSAPLTNTFPADSKLEAVYTWIASERPGVMGKLSQTFPRKVLDGPERSKTLKDLGKNSRFLCFGSPITNYQWRISFRLGSQCSTHLFVNADNKQSK